MTSVAGSAGRGERRRLGSGRGGVGAGQVGLRHGSVLPLGRRHVNAVAAPATRAERSPAATEIGFLCEDVRAAYQRAIDAGGTSISPPAKPPWPPTIAFVRDDEGVLIEFCSPPSRG
jgi:lactoylglutathione lyase